MNHIPALSSILCPEHLATWAETKYGLSTCTQTGILKTGINHNYSIQTTNGNYVLRVYFKDWKTEEEIAEELKLLHYLNENNVGVSYPIKDLEQQYIQQIEAPEGLRYAVLFSYAEGESIKNPSEKVCRLLGKSMAEMHQLTAHKSIGRKTYTSDTLVAWAYDTALSFFPESNPEMHYFKRAKELIHERFTSADATKLRSGIVHLDLWYDNMAVQNEDRITFFDFDNTGNGWLFLDIGYSLMLIFKNEPDKELFKRKMAAFYEGYESITGISEEEKELVPFGGLAIWLHYTGIHVQRFNDFTNHFLSNDFLKFWIHTVNEWMKYNRISI